MGVKITELDTTSYNGSDYIPVANTTDGTRKLLTADIASAVGVPTDVRQAILTLFQQAAYSDDTDRTEEIELLTEWASTTVTAITLSQTSISFTEEGSVTLTATLYPSDATGTVLWSSSDTSVATVSGGVVTAVGNGSCTITASVGNVYASCAVTVSGIAEVYTVTNVLTSCTTNNSATQITEGLTYTATLTADSGYALADEDVVVTMGGDTLSGAVSGGVITIAEVTGDIVITATAAATFVFVAGYTNGYVSTSGVGEQERLQANTARMVCDSNVGTYPLLYESGDESAYYPFHIEEGITQAAFSGITYSSDLITISRQILQYDETNGWLRVIGTDWTSNTDYVYDLSSYNDGSYYIAFNVARDSNSTAQIMDGVDNTYDMSTYDTSGWSVAFS